MDTSAAAEYLQQQQQHSAIIHVDAALVVFLQADGGLGLMQFLCQPFLT